MLYIRYGTDWRLNARLAVEEVCQMPTRPEQKRILIVPEQNSFDAEWAVCARGGDGVSRYAQVLSFTRLASRVFSETGGAAAAFLDQSGRMIAMAGALEQIRTRLKRYGAQITKPEFLQQLLRMTDEFRGCGIRAEEIRAAAGKLPADLTEKLEELCLILEAYDAVCSGAKQDPSTRLNALRDALYDGNFAAHAHIVIEGFTDFTNQELEVLEALLQNAAQVTVYLTCDSLAGGQTVFAAARSTAIRLENLAGRRNVLKRAAKILLPAERSPRACLAEQLFSPRLQSWEEETDQIGLSTAVSAEAECEAAVGRVQQLLFSGVRCREIGIVCTDPNVYLPLLENLTDRYEIPAYFSGSRELLRSGVVRGVLYALEAASCGMEAEAVAEYLKSGYAPISRDFADRIENYAFVWNLRGSRWDRPFDRDPAGLRVDRTADPDLTAAALLPLNEAREQAVGPLLRLRRGLNEAKNTAGQILALDRFLQELGLEARLTQDVEKHTESGAFQTAQELSQLYEILLGTMEQIYGVLGRTVRSPEDFYRFFKAALTQNSVGTVPATLDAVRIGQLSAMRHTEAGYLLVLGAGDGKLPQPDAGGGLLSDAERRSMRAAGLPTSPDDGERMDRELLSVYTVLTGPEKGLFLSCVQGSPSYLFSRMEKLFPHCDRSVFAPLPSRPSQAAAALASADETARGLLSERAPELAAAARALLHRADYTPGSLEPRAVEALYGRSYSLSPSKIEKFESCRYAYYLNYGLKTRERRQASVDPRIYGTFVHDVLENTVRAVMAEGGFHTVTAERTEELALAFCEQFAEENLNGLEEYSERGAYLFRRNFREVLQIVRELYGEMHLSAFEPVSCELRFEGETAIPITGNLASGYLIGAVDRVDLYTTRSGKTYLRVVDYKTGKKDFDYTDLISGLGLQMLLYLFTLTREAEQFYGKQLEPAGVLYFPTHYDVESMKCRPSEADAEKEHRKKLRRKGIILNDPEILQAMEPNTIPLYLPSSVVKGPDSDALADEAGFAALKRHVARTLGRVADEIAKGDIRPQPYWRGEKNNACVRCDYREICRVDSGEVPLRRRREIKFTEFWEELREEDRHGG